MHACRLPAIDAGPVYTECRDCGRRWVLHRRWCNRHPRWYEIAHPIAWTWPRVVVSLGPAGNVEIRPSGALAAILYRQVVELRARRSAFYMGSAK